MVAPISCHPDVTCKKLSLESCGELLSVVYDFSVDACMYYHPQLPPLAVRDVRDLVLVIDVHIQPVLPEVLGHHHARLDDARLLGQVLLGEELHGMSVTVLTPRHAPAELTVSLESVSCSCLPTSLLDHSSVLSLGAMVVLSKRGMSAVLLVSCGVVVVVLVVKVLLTAMPEMMLSRITSSKVLAETRSII